VVQRQPGEGFAHPAAVAVHGGIGPLRVAAAVQREEPGTEADGGNQGDDQPAGGVTVEARVTDIWLPQTLADVARRELPSLADPGQDGLRRRLERRPVPRLFYAFTVRTLQVNGGVSTLTFLRGSPSEAIDLDQFLDVLATAAGRPPVRPGVDYTGATLHVLPSATSQRELLEAIRASNLQSVP